MPMGVCAAPSSSLRQCLLPFPSGVHSLAAIYFAFAEREAKCINVFPALGQSQGSAFWGETPTGATALGLTVYLEPAVG